MGQSFLTYRKEKQLKNAISEKRLDHSTSAQAAFKKISPGDTLWIIGCRSRKPVTLGPLKVDNVLGPVEAELRLGKRPFDFEQYTAICREGDETFPREVILEDVLAKLRFASKVSPALDLQEGLKWQQLRTLRELTPESDRILR